MYEVYIDKKLEARVARLEKFIKNEDAELSHLIEAGDIYNAGDTVNIYNERDKWLVIH